MQDVKTCSVQQVHYKMEWWNEMPFTVWYRMIQVVSMMKLICHGMSNAWLLVTVPRYLQLTASSQLICSIDPGTHAYLLQCFFWGDFKLIGWIFLYSHHHASLVSPKNILFSPPSLSHCEGSAAFPAAPHLLSDFWVEQHSSELLNSFLAILCELLGMVI